MSEATTIPAKYIFLDVVGFSRDRSVEAQTDIVEALNRIVEAAILEIGIPKNRRILLPTGDGMCIALLNFETPHDAHLLIALSIIKQVYEYSHSIKDPMRQFKVRIGLNAHNDNLVIDINGKRNIAGAGINMSERIMSAADGNQILVGESVYANFKQFEEYMSSFEPFEIIDKHGNRIPIYQYIAEDKIGLNTDVPTTFRNPDISGIARACGLQNIYPFRNEEVLNDLVREIKRAERRIFISGVGLSEVVRLKDLLPILDHKIKHIEKFKVKILLLDALRSPSVYRTFLESDLNVFRDIYKDSTKALKKTRFKHPYFRQRLYRDFENAYEALKEVPSLKAATRFYAHNPNCWLVIIDDIAYFQPYAFGGNVDQENHPIGPLLPVFKLQSEADVNVFSILEDHFNKLWVTSDSDLFLVGARIEDRERRIRLVFGARKQWFKHALGALDQNKKTPGEDRRKFPRRPCQSPIRDVKVSWGKGNVCQKITAEIINFSYESAWLRFEGSNCPVKGKIVKLEIPRDPERPTGMRSEMSWEMLEAKYLKANFVESTDGVFKVTRVADNQSYIALRAHKGKSPI